jgi:hypothetical protein
MEWPFRVQTVNIDNLNEKKMRVNVLLSRNLSDCAVIIEKGLKSSLRNANYFPGNRLGVSSRNISCGGVRLSLLGTPPTICPAVSATGGR